ncbi:Clavaminate synthase-like protein [Auriscalpium vulgare]|uniref:Clavaminate synthase-like protein n=1 Tax=Auriscalpium vulgare TaxID=40419 RepID=A0ACB8RVK1_9AGAM|nr:Clavaminate synthase-like protein [Auriscalpium vulgare]
MPGIVLPPFPEDVPTSTLLVIDYAKIKAGDPEEIDTLWTAATELGFWYLKNHGAEEEVDGMFDMGAETMALPSEEKMKFEQGNDGLSFGYKYAGSYMADHEGTPDTSEFINVARDDALGWPTVRHRTYPSTVNARMESTVRPFIRKAVDVTTVLFGVFDKKLGLPEGTFASLHAPDQETTSESRCIRSLQTSPGKAALAPHTDFGSLSFLHNRLGGLQVLPVGSQEWQYVKPLPGHAICNIGDAVTIFSGGILHSNLHRIVSPPKPQTSTERWSVAYFARPNSAAVLEPFSEQSSLIAESAAKAPEGKYNPGVTAGEWFARRIRAARLPNRKGLQSWDAGQGMEWQNQKLKAQ